MHQKSISKSQRQSTSVIYSYIIILILSFFSTIPSESFSKTMTKRKPIVETFLPVGNYAIPVQQECTNNHSEIHAVSVKIYDIDSKDLSNSKVLHYKSDSHGDYENSLDPTPIKLKKYHTDIDFDASEYLKVKGDVILLSIFLDQPNVYFVKGLESITTNDSEYGKMFCVKVPLYAGKKTKKLSFYVKYLSDGTGKALVGGYYIAVPGKVHGFRIIDPNVKNSGLD